MTPDALRALSPYVKKAQQARVAEACELCAAPIDPVHRHVVDVKERRMQCVCATCARVFDSPSGRQRTVPMRVVAGATDAPSFEQWRSLGVPVGLAFFIRASTLGRWVGIFPSPAGATEAELPEAAWAAIEAACPLAREVRDDVEALVVRSTRSGRSDVFLAPIDLCYEAVGALRARWTGFDGGDEARAAVDDFVDTLAKRAEGS